MIAHCAFNLPFPEITHWASFQVLVDHSYIYIYTLVKCLFRSFYDLKFELLDYFVCLSSGVQQSGSAICFELQEFFIYFRFYSLIWYMVCKYLLPFCGLSFCFLDDVFWKDESFNFVEPKIFWSLVLLVSWKLDFNSEFISPFLIIEISGNRRII